MKKINLLAAASLASTLLLGSCCKHVDVDNDHKCDECGETISQCVDENRDHACDVCGADVGEHADKSGDGNCDYCGVGMPRVNSITILGAPEELMVSKTATLTVNVNTSNGAAKTVTWSSSDTSIATVAENGVVTAVAPGNVTITATATADSSKTASVEISIVELNWTAEEVAMLQEHFGQTLPFVDAGFEWTDSYFEKYGCLTAESSEEGALDAAAEVYYDEDDFFNCFYDESDNSYTIYMESEVSVFGTLYISIYEDKGTTSIDVYLTADIISGDEDYLLEVGSTQQLNDVLNGELPDGVTITYESSAPDKVAVSENGLITVLAEGGAVISATDGFVVDEIIVYATDAIPTGWTAEQAAEFDKLAPGLSKQVPFYSWFTGAMYFDADEEFPAQVIAYSGYTTYGAINGYLDEFFMTDWVDVSADDLMAVLASAYGYPYFVYELTYQDENSGNWYCATMTINYVYNNQISKYGNIYATIEAEQVEAPADPVGLTVANQVLAAMKAEELELTCSEVMEYRGGTYGFDIEYNEFKPAWYANQGDALIEFWSLIKSGMSGFALNGSVEATEGSDSYFAEYVNEDAGAAVSFYTYVDEETNKVHFQVSCYEYVAEESGEVTAESLMLKELEYFYEEEATSDDYDISEDGSLTSYFVVGYASSFSTLGAVLDYFWDYCTIEEFADGYYWSGDFETTYYDYGTFESGNSYARLGLVTLDLQFVLEAYAYLADYNGTQVAVVEFFIYETPEGMFQE